MKTRSPVKGTGMSSNVKAAPAWHVALTSQFGGVLDMLGNAIRACPPEVWDETRKPVEFRFWYLTFHNLFWLDRYFEPIEVEHRPPAPFTLDEIDPKGIYPDRTYTKEELLQYLDYGRDKVRNALAALDDERAAKPSGVPRLQMSQLELYLYSLRHTTHHTAQLQQLIRQGGVAPPKWVRSGKP